MFVSVVLNEIWIIDPRHRSFFSLDWYVHEFIQFFSFFEKSSFKLCCSHQACCLRYYLGEIKSGIHMYRSLPLNLYTSVFGCGCGFRFEQKFWRIDGSGEKRQQSADSHTPIHPPLIWPLLGMGKTCQKWECDKHFVIMTSRDIACFVGSKNKKKFYLCWQKNFFCQHRIPSFLASHENSKPTSQDTL